ncbi:dimethylsulfoniopropionate cleavage enzyme DddD [Roseovarius nanhaiticus]|uniref:Dimethylsulfoniopropionate cleavage enzyme DddD n=1 Tax=Roseovarius nanhaiticus TaxID=573024 RepID=A0A1N7H801_9RHOB|nr:CoA transferase [Roseovarius nanhaiticus]SEL09800.1 dimethylsulfoniopropionate cleavage enzyme DddD [Roseovarius nanhaiticus]SIS20903.1 dimethylsulfoniopropionate cleavage enzyme DddD [Roseovarius nanhaiticus]
MRNNFSNLPLNGVKIIDFGQYIAGPAVAMLLGDLGATVVHVDPPEGPMWQSPANAILNRNKVILNLDLKSEQGLADARALIAEADIVIENFRPGKLAALGLDFAELRAQRPELITLSIPGFASNDEARREQRAFESIVAASSGVFTDMGLNRVLMGINPSFSPLPLASAYAAQIAASSTVLALQSRQLTGLGDHIEVPLAAAVMEGLCYNSIKVENMPERYLTQREVEIERRRIEGLPMNISYEDLQELLDPFFRAYMCKDGRMFYVVCPSHKYHARRCLEVLGILDELVEQGLTEEDDTYKPWSEWSSKVSLGVYPMPKDWADIIAARMKEVFMTRTSHEWKKMFGRAGIPGAPQRWLQEWIHDEYAETSGLMIDVWDPEYGDMTQPGPVVWMEESGEEALSPEPRRWVEMPEALKILRRHRTDIPDPVDDAPEGWLSGVRILDLCNVIAGPHSASYLARFGAEVIKLDPSQPLYDSWNTVMYGMSQMRGKRSILADLKSQHGRQVFEDLVKTVDVIVWNAPDSQIKRMGLNAESLRKLNPDAIFCKLDCFSGVRRGTRTDYIGYDDLVQATTGIMLRFGGAMDRPEEHAHVGTIDVMCGFGGALAVASALYQKHRFGRIGRGRTSLSANSGLLQVPFAFDYKGRGLFDEPSGPDCNGSGDLNRFYSTASGRHILLSAYEADLPRFRNVEGLEDLPDIAPEDRAAYLATAIQGQRASEWVARLRAADIAVAICDNLDALRAEHSRIADGTPGTENGSYSFSVYPDHPSGHEVTQLDPYAVRPSRTKVFAVAPPEKFGTSTRAIARELGYSDKAIDAMLASGGLSESWSDEYLPS